MLVEEERRGARDLPSCESLNLNWDQ
jgi:hypothetical protein